MRVGFFHPEFKGVGGAENLIALQAAYLRGRGHEISIISTIHERWRRAFHDLDLRSFNPYPWHNILLPSDTRLLHSLPRVAAALRGCDAVIAHNFPCCALLGHSELPGVTRAWYCNEPHRRLHLPEANPFMYARSQVVTPTSIAERAFDRKLRLYRYEMRVPSGKRRRRQLDLKLTPQVEIICANSEFTRDNLRRIYGRDDAHVVYPIVRFPEHGRARTGIDRTRGLQILTQSRLDSVKNIDQVLRAFALYRTRAAAGAQLHIVGVGPEARSLRALAAELALGSSVRFHGFLPASELERIYDSCDVFALAPIDEPFGMVFPEAAARGLLLVGPNHGGPNEILDGGRLGWTCDPFVAESMAEAFERIAACSDAELDARRAQLNQACRARFDEAVVGPLLERLVLGAAASGTTAVR